MFRRVAAVLSATVVTSLGAALLTVPTAPPAAADEHRDRSDLAVRIDSVTPSTAPSRPGAEVTLTGRVWNRSDSDWTDLQAYLFAGSEPLTSEEALTEATASDPALEVGARLTDAGQFDELPDLAPGERTTFRLSVSREELPFSSPGVYWIGVHVLGSNEDGRLEGADGRARTFIPLLDDTGARARLSLLAPVRARVRRTPEGQLQSPEVWARRLGPQGRLGRLVSAASTAPGGTLTWLVDPAVLLAVADLAAGNPPFDMTPTTEESTEGESPTESPSPSDPSSTTPSTSPAPTDTDPPAPVAPDETELDQGQDGPGEEVVELAEEAQLAQGWLADFAALTESQPVVHLPYGDLDVAATLRHRFDESYRRAVDLGDLTMAELGFDSSPVLAPLGGHLPTRAVERLDADTSVLLAEDAVPVDATRVQLPGDVDVVRVDDAALVGGPAPTPRHAALAVRQQVLAEAAVHALSGDPDPLVVALPDRWDPGAAWRQADFFRGLDVPWLSTVPLPMVTALSRQETYREPLRYPAAARRAELPRENLRATRRLRLQGGVLAELLARNDTIDTQLSRTALLGSSAHFRERPRAALRRTERVTARVRRLLSSVHVENSRSSRLVTMSSQEGNFSVTIVNELDQAVTVGIDVTTDSDELDIRPPDQVTLGPGQRAPVRFGVTSRDTGVHSVRVVPTTVEGHRLGRATEIKLRSSQVGLVIWLVMGIGGVLFVAALTRRVVRRVRERKATHGPVLKGVER